MKLTPKQHDAVTAAGSVAVTAGAGTGKTAMLARRFVHHVVVDGFSPLEIAAITFTEKAAAELRSRIRTEIAAARGDEAAAETEAAQISTIHALAARICRDHFALAEIPADFAMLDELDATIISADLFDEALAAIDADVVRALGYTWLREALGALLRDQPAAESVLQFDEQHYRELIEKRREAAIGDLQTSDCWRAAKKILDENQGSNNDKLEPHRVAVVNAISDIAAGRNIMSAVAAVLAVKLNVGAKGNWPHGMLQQVKDCMKDLRTALAEGGEFSAVSFEFGGAESEMCRRAELLRRAFSSAADYLRRVKLQRRTLDFGDLEHFALKVLAHPEARQHYAERWKAILVDEFQDTNPVQEKLLLALAEARPRLTIVGDGKQSIYGFRRADPRVFQRFRESIDNEVILDRTFRTHAGLVEYQNIIFREILAASHQPLDAERKEHPHAGPFIEAHSFNDDDADINEMRSVEGSFIADQIGRLINDALPVWDKESKSLRPIEPRDVAILSRTRKPLEIYINELIRAGVPAVNSGGGSLLDTPTAKDMAALIRFVADPSDDVALVSLLRGPFFAVSDITLYEFSLVRQENETWWKLISRESSRLERAQKILTRFLDLSRSVSAESLLEIADEKTGYTAVVANLEQGDRRMADWFGFLALLRRFAANGRSDVFGVHRYFKDMERSNSVVPRPPLAAGNAVSLMTIHAAKGLEWPVVFVPNLSANKNRSDGEVSFDAEIGVGFKVNLNMENGAYERVAPAIYKIIRSKKESDERAEDARILYVAMTRAQDRLYLTSAGRPANDLETLAPALEAAGIAIQTHDTSYQPITSQPALEKPSRQFTNQLEAIASAVQ